jgi:hypothetical protein
MADCLVLSSEEFGIQQDQAVLYSTACVKLANNNTGIFSGLAAGTYVVGIMYDPGTVVGQTSPGATARSCTRSRRTWTTPRCFRAPTA